MAWWPFFPVSVLPLQHSLWCGSSIWISFGFYLMFCSSNWTSDKNISILVISLFAWKTKKLAYNSTTIGARNELHEPKAPLPRQEITPISCHRRFCQPFPDCQTKITYVVGYLQKESPFLTKHPQIFFIGKLSSYSAFSRREGG
jgi:hypothetical protein